MFVSFGGAVNAARARYFSDLGHFGAMWIPLALGIDFSRFLGSGRLSTLRARSTSAIWANLVPCGFHWLWGLIFYVFFYFWEALNAARARGTSAILAILVPQLDSIGPGDRFSMFFRPGEALNAARTRYLSDQTILVPCGFHWLRGTIFDVSQSLGGSQCCARAVLQRSGPF